MKTREAFEFGIGHLETYFEGQDDTYKKEIFLQSSMAPEPSPTCRVMVAMPLYNEANIYATLKLYTTSQCEWQEERSDKVRLEPGVYEINLLLNSPDDQSWDNNDFTRSEIKRFLNDFPEFRVNVFEKKFNFTDRVQTGEVFKYIADICVARALKVGNANICIRSSGADSIQLDPYLIGYLASQFESSDVAMVNNRFSYPRSFLEENPLVYFIDYFHRILFALVKRGSFHTGPNNFSAESYCLSGGFNNPCRPVGEDVDLARRIALFAREHSMRVVKPGRIESYNDPRRIVHSIATAQRAAYRYVRFGLSAEDEDGIRSDSENQNGASNLVFNEQNLNRELSAYYQLTAYNAFQFRFAGVECLETRVEQSLDWTSKIIMRALYFLLGPTAKDLFKVETSNVQLDAGGISQFGGSDNIVSCSGGELLRWMLLFEEFEKQKEFESKLDQ